MKTKPKVGQVRYDQAKRAAIKAYLKDHTNEEAKAKFGCSAHFAGSLRKAAPLKATRPTIKEALKKGKFPAPKTAAKKSLL